MIDKRKYPTDSSNIKPLMAAGYELPQRILETLGSGIGFDIGANDGAYIHFLSRMALVHAYEPVPSVFSRLSAKFRTSPNIRCHQLGVGENKGRAENLNVYNAWSLLPDGTKMDHCQLVSVAETPFSMDVTTLDSEAEKHGLPDFIKLDVDGYEAKVLRGGVETLKRKPCPIMFEFSYLPQYFGDSVREMLDLIYSLGYQMWSMDGCFCARDASICLKHYPAHTSYDVMLIHRSYPM